MPDGFTTITDLPTILAGDGAPVVSTIQIAEIGRFKDPRYGTFEITARDVDSWRRLLAGYFQGEIPLDFDHNTDTGGTTGSKAAGWIKSIDQQGTRVMARVEWTPAGVESVSEREYRYLSPTFVSDLKDQRQRSLGPALLRVALTNNPFLRHMPAISLSASPGELGAELLERACATPDPVDSRPAMPDLTKIAEALKLSADATEDQVLEAVGELAAKADTKPETVETKTLAQMAASEGKILMTADQYADLQQKASEGAAAAVTLHEQRFETAYAKALAEGRVDAKEETKTLHKGVYEADPDKSVRLLEQLPQVINVTGSQTRKVDQPVDGDDRMALHKKAEAYALEHKVDYDKAVLAVAQEENV